MQEGDWVFVKPGEYGQDFDHAVGQIKRMSDDGSQSLVKFDFIFRNANEWWIITDHLIKTQSPNAVIRNEALEAWNKAEAKAKKTRDDWLRDIFSPPRRVETVEAEEGHLHFFGYMS